MAIDILSFRAVEAATLPAGKKETLLSDGGGLYLRVRNLGQISKTWQYIYTAADGKRRKMTLGAFPDHSLAKARAWAKKKRALLDDGIDPIEQEKQAEIEIQRNQVRTLSSLLDGYVDYLKSKGRPSAKEAANNFRLHVADAIKQKPANQITSDEIALTVRKLVEAKKGRTAGKLRNYLHAAFSVAIAARHDAGMSSDLAVFNIIVNPVPVMPSLGDHNKARTRALDRHELRAFISWLDGIPQDDKKDAVLLALLTGGQRVTQLLRADLGKWTDGSPVIVMLDGKGRRREARRHVIPLIGRARKLVEVSRKGKLFHLSDQDKIDTTLRDLSTWVKRLSKQMFDTGLVNTPFGLGDVRRTAETHMAAMSVSKDTRAQLQSHGLSGVQDRHYDQHSYTQEKITVLQAWEAYLYDESANNVVEIGQGKSPGRRA